MTKSVCQTMAVETLAM